MEIFWKYGCFGRLQQKTPDGNVSKRIGALLPTPTVQDGENNAVHQYCRNTYPLDVIAGTNANPPVGQWLMGFPFDHTACKAEQYGCAFLSHG